MMPNALAHVQANLTKGGSEAAATPKTACQVQRSLASCATAPALATRRSAVFR
jgi:hypothetical protein